MENVVEVSGFFQSLRDEAEEIIMIEIIRDGLGMICDKSLYHRSD